MTGSRQTRSVATWLHETLTARGYDTCTLVLSDPPHVRYDGFEFPVSPTVRGIENAIHRFTPVEVLVVENIRPDKYAMRVINEDIVRPHSLLVLNIRPDHGVFGGLRATARAIARSTTTRTEVISGEQHPVGRKVLNNELSRENIPVSHAAIPANYWSLPDSECVFVIDAFLRSFDSKGLDKVESFIDRLRARWTVVDGTRVYVADTVTDPVSLDRLRKWLCDGTMRFQPVVVAQRSQDARIAAFIRYFNDLATHGHISHAHVVGPDLGSAIRSTEFDVILHEDTTANEVFADVASHGSPMIVFGTGQSQLLADFKAVIRRRAARDRRGFRPAAPRSPTMELHRASAARFRTESLEYANLAGMNVLVIDPTGNPDRWLDERKIVGHRRKMGIISVGAAPRLRGASAPVNVEVLEEPLEPAEIPMLAEIYLEEWQDPTIVCITAVHSLIEQLGRTTGIEVIRILAEDIREADGTAYFHVDPTAVDDRVVQSIQRAVTGSRHRPSPVVTG